MPPRQCAENPVTVDSFIATYGYLAVLIGVFVEGELVVMTAGFFAHRAVLQLDWVIVAALLGSVLTYQFFFLLGRLQGARFLQRRPHWQARVAKVQGLLERHHVGVTFGYRALIGFRAVTPFALGMTRISHRRFFALDMIPATAWALTFPCLGYLLGRELEPVLGQIHKYEGWAALTVAAMVTAAVGITLAVRRARR
jgi:membrane protein DedA with SNARE-associated domain